MDPNRRYVSRVSTDGFVSGYPDYGAPFTSYGYAAPADYSYQVINHLRVCSEEADYVYRFVKETLEFCDV